MTAQPNFHQNFGAAPPGSTGMSRLMPHIKTIAAGGALATIVFMGLQIVLPDGWKPSDIAGIAAGSAERYETLTKQDVKINYERMLADATAQANAKAQIDIALMQKVLEERSQGLAGQSGLAVLADALCLSGNAVAGMTASQPVDWRSQSTGDLDWHSGAVQVAHSTCGMGDALRTNVTQSQLDAVRAAAAARGSPMSNGALQTIAVPRVVEVPDWKMITVQHRIRDNKDRNLLQAYADRLPIEVQQSFAADLDAGQADFYDRVATYRAAHFKG